MRFRKIGRSLGLTKERKTELSEVLYETASVAAKNHQEGEDNAALGMAMGNLALGMAMSEDERHDILFQGPRTSFGFNDKDLFHRFNEGDDVRIGYRERHTVTSDYVPPNFDHKKPVGRVLSGYEFVSAERLDE